MTTVTPDKPADQPDQIAAKRAAFVAGLHEFANWIEERPWAPIMRQTGYEQAANLQIDLYGGEGLAEVRAIADRLGVKARENADDRTALDVHVGSVSYSVIAWHPGGRPGEREAELEKLRAEVAALRAAAASSGLGYTRADTDADDPTPVSSARGPLHTGGMVDGGELVDETDDDRACAHRGDGEDCECNGNDQPDEAPDGRVIGRAPVDEPATT